MAKLSEMSAQLREMYERKRGVEPPPAQTAPQAIEPHGDDDSDEDAVYGGIFKGVFRADQE